MIILDIIQITLLSITGSLVGYQVLLGLAAFKIRQKTEFTEVKNARFAIVIPAHNEEKMISKTIYSINGIIYPQSLYEIFVIADNCTDRTAELAKDLGAHVLERDNPKERGKGYALRWGFDKILSEHNHFDAMVVIDSDSLVSGNYLEVMNFYLQKGSRVIQSSDLVLPQPENWSSEATRIGFLLTNYVKPLGRKYFGLNMGLRGNGMCFAVDVLIKTPWQSWALTEDLEYGLILMLKGEHIDFAPEGYVWAQMPLQSANAESQRERWEQGRKHISRMYAPTFLKEAFKRNSYSFFDVFIDLITPPFVNTMLVVLLLMVLNMGYWFYDPSKLYFLLLWGGVAMLGVTHLFLGLYLAKADKHLYKSLLYIPLYALWKIKVAFKSLFSSQQINWVRTTRDSQ
jgi:cellulose synthase/poly-beta-1,6-N-acetylglucosamine synthase-like glycosyltransferase